MKKSMILLLASFCQLLSAQVPFVKNFGNPGLEFYANTIHSIGDRYVSFGNGRSDGQRDLDIYMHYLDENIQLEQSIPISRPGIQEVVESIAFLNGNYVVAAITNETSTNRNDVLILGLDAEGTVLWEELFSTSFDDNIVDGYLSTNGEEAVFLIEEQDELDVASFRLLSFQLDGSNHLDIPLNWTEGAVARTCSPMPNEGFLVGGSQNGQSHLSRFDMEGNLIWSKTIPEPWASNGVVDDVIYDATYDQLLVGLNLGSFDEHFLVLDANADQVLFNEHLSYISANCKLTITEYNGSTFVWILEGSRIEILERIEETTFESVSSVFFGNIDEILGFSENSSLVSVIGKASSVAIGGIEAARISKSVEPEVEEIALFENNIAEREEFRSLAISPSGDWFVSASGTAFYEANFQRGIVKLNSLGIASDTFATLNTSSTNIDLAPLGDQKLVQAYSVNRDSQLHIINIYDLNGQLLDSLSFLEEKPMFNLQSNVQLTTLSDGTIFTAIGGRVSNSSFLHVLKVAENGSLLDTFDLSNQHLGLLRNMITLSNDEIILTGRDHDRNILRVLKLNANGEVLWNKVYNDDIYAIGYGISENPEGDKIAISSRLFTEVGESGVYWAELDLDGNVLHEQMFHETGTFYYPYIYYNSLGELLIHAVYFNPLANTDEEQHAIRYWKFDSDGILLETTNYFSQCGIWESQLIENDYLVLVGRQQRENDRDAFIMVLNANGTLTSTDEVFSSFNNFNISPNPSSGFCQIQLDNPFTGIIRLELFDAQGQLLYTKEDKKTSHQWQYAFNQTNLASGNYTIRLTTAQGSMAKLWIKQ